MPSSVSSPIDPVVAHLATAADSHGVAGSDLLSVLSKVPDPRARRGVRHAMSAILAVALCAVLAGARSLTAIGQWAANASGEVLAALGVLGCPPSESCLRRSLQSLPGERLDAVLGEWACCHTSRRGGCRAVAVDGKTVRGSRSTQGPARHLMAAIDHHAGVVLGQVEVPGKPTRSRCSPSCVTRSPSWTA
jgi:DDE family transposase